MIMSVCAAIIVYENARATCCTYLPDFDLPGSTTRTYQLGTFALALLLAARVGRTYDRWWQARQAFGSVNSSCSQIAHLAAIWCDDVEHVKRLIAWLNVFQYTVLMVCVFLCAGCAARQREAPCTHSRQGSRAAPSRTPTQRTAKPNSTPAHQPHPHSQKKNSKCAR